MQRFLILFLVTICALASATRARGQAATPSPAAATQADKSITPNLVVGEVTAIDGAAKQMTVKTDGGAVVAVVLGDKTAYLRAQPGASSLEKAARINLADIRLGDRVVARGKVAADRASVNALQLIVMTKEDIAQKQERDREEWRRRGIVGVVSALNPATKEITLQLRSLADAQTLVIEGGVANVKFRRYAPDSVKFSDAKASTFAELKVGDQLRAKGDRSTDGSRFTAEEIVSGSFRMLRGSVEAVNATSNEITVKDLQSGQTVTVVVSPDSTLRRIPAEFAARMAARSQGRAPGGDEGGGAARPATGGGDGRRPSNPDGEGAGGERRMGNRARTGGASLQDFLERMPTVTVAELKAGDVVIVSSTTGADPSRITAIALVAGAEALMQQAPGARGGRGQGATLGMPQGAMDIGIGGP